MHKWTTALLIVARTSAWSCAQSRPVKARSPASAACLPRLHAAPLAVLDLQRTTSKVKVPVEPTAEDECVGDRRDSGVSYRTQFEELFEASGSLRAGVRTSKPVNVQRRPPLIAAMPV